MLRDDLRKLKNALRTETTMKTRRGLHDDDDDSEGDENENGGDGKSGGWRC
jgi:hypothetical protein